MNRSTIFALITFVLLPSGLVGAAGFKHEFRNPTFGGNPMYSTHLAYRASAQDDFKAPSSREPESLLAQFEERLMSSVLAAYSRSVSGQLFDEEGNFVEGTITIGDFSVIASSNDLGGIQLTISDGATGGNTVINLPAVSFE